MDDFLLFPNCQLSTVTLKIAIPIIQFISTSLVFSLSVPCTSYHCPPILGLSAELVMTYLWGNHETVGWNRGTDTISLVCIFRSIPVQLSGVAVSSHVMNTDQCHSKTIRSQYHHSQALQLTVDSFLKRFFSLQAWQYNNITFFEKQKRRNWVRLAPCFYA